MEFLNTHLVLVCHVETTVTSAKALGVDERMTEKGIDRIFDGNAEVDLLELLCRFHQSNPFWD